MSGTTNQDKTIASLQAELADKDREIEQLRNGLQQNLGMLGELEAMYSQERDEMEENRNSAIRELKRKLKLESKEKSELAEKLATTEQQLSDLTAKMTLMESPHYDQHQPFWEFMKEMELVSQLLTNRIAQGKQENPNGNTNGKTNGDLLSSASSLASSLASSADTPHHSNMNVNNDNTAHPAVAAPHHCFES